MTGEGCSFTALCLLKLPAYICRLKDVCDSTFQDCGHRIVLLSKWVISLIYIIQSHLTKRDGKQIESKYVLIPRRYTDNLQLRLLLLS